MTEGFGLVSIGAVVLLASLAASAAMIAMLRPLMVRYALARPNARSSHREPTPQGGGIAVMLSALGISVLALFAAGRTGVEAWAIVSPVFTATLALTVVGAIDDIRTLPAGFRLVLHTLAVAAVVQSVPPELRLVPHLPFWAERVLVVTAGVWFVNLVNFMDGLDWITVAEVVPVTLGLAAIGFLGGLPPYATLIALALMGAMLGFAPFNRPVARLFLGDVGSLPIGLLLGWLLLVLALNGHHAAAIILPLYYLADATITLMRRAVRRERVWIAHRTHFYQRATDRGLTVPGIVARVFGVNILLLGLALLTVIVPSTAARLGALIAACALVGALLYELARPR